MKGGTLAVPHVAVVGTAQREIVPDQLQWHIVVRQQAVTVTEVAAQQPQRVAVVLQLLQAAGIEESAMATTRMSLRERFEHNQQLRRRERVGFTAKHTFHLPRKTLIIMSRSGPVWPGWRVLPSNHRSSR